MPQKIKRGYAASDLKEFSDEVIPVLQAAQRDVVYLIDRGYRLEHAVTFVGNHLQFSARQRAALIRATAITDEVRQRQNRQLCQNLCGKTVLIDGFNLIITLEAAQSPETSLFRCMDKTIRDLCGLHGSYRIIEATIAAIRWGGEMLKQKQVGRVIFYLDSPVSNSGRLKALIAEEMVLQNIPCDICLVHNADAQLWGREYVVTSDSVILDRCISWINLAEEIISEKLPERRIINLSNQFKA